MVWFGDEIIQSEEGPQQGDPLCPLLFCLAIHPILASLQSDLAFGYMDDLTLGGVESTVAADVDKIIENGDKVGVHTNIRKYELIHAPQFAPRSSVLCSFTLISPDEASLLGTSLLSGKKLNDLPEGCCLDLSRAIDRLKLIESHDALILPRSCFCAPKIQHILMCTPSHDNPCLRTFDGLLRTGLSTISNCDFSDSQCYKLAFL